MCAPSGAGVDGVAFRRIMPTPSEPPAGTWCSGGAGVFGALSSMPREVVDPWPVGAADPWPVGMADRCPVGAADPCPVGTADPWPVGAAAAGGDVSARSGVVGASRPAAGAPAAEPDVAPGSGALRTAAGTVADPEAAAAGADPDAAATGADPDGGGTGTEAEAAGAAADPGTGGVAGVGDIRVDTGADVECALLRRIVPAGRESSAGASWSGAAVVGRDRGTTVAVVLAERPSPAGIPGGAPPFALAEPGARCPFSTGSGRGATSLPAAPRIEPLKVISGTRRTTTGLPVIAAVVPPGACPASDGTVPTALRRFRAGRSVAGQITAAVNPAAPATGAGPGPNVGREGPGVGARGGDVSDP